MRTSARMGLAAALILSTPAATAAAPRPAAGDAFAWDLFRAALEADPGGDVAVAPASVAATLAMAFEGADGATAGEIARVLGLDAGADPAILAGTGKVEVRERLSLGANLASNEGYGVKVVDVPAGSAAERAGLEPGDLILALDGRPHRSAPRLRQALERGSDRVRLRIFEYATGEVVEREAALARERPNETPSRPLHDRIVFVQRGSAIAPDYRERLRDAYGAAVAEVDFRGDPAGSLASIRKGLDHGAEILGDDLVGPDTRALFLDRFAFRGRWSSPFRPAEPGKFRPDQGPEADVPMMRQVARLPLAKSSRYSVLALPCEDVRASLLILLPAEGVSLDQAIRGMNAGELAASARAAMPTLVDVALPKFRRRRPIALERALAGLGMPRAFGDEAEFPKLDSRHPTRLSAVRQVVEVEVDELGARAGAVTAAAAVLIKGDEPEPTIFHADRPFLFALRDEESGSLLLLGVFRGKDGFAR